MGRDEEEDGEEGGCDGEYGEEASGERALHSSAMKKDEL